MIDRGTRCPVQREGELWAHPEGGKPGRLPPPVRSLKGRGADLMLSTLAPSTAAVCASSGNVGHAVAYAGRARGMPVHVFVPKPVDSARRARMKAFGAGMVTAGPDGA
ncbi:pyridoxal-phosphate dependent enzyme [Streptomyces sp. NPDC101194]|uniref:pyridoxal-phosphate dependent enzyme n=1 Tax=Streptomyces sp. NPDC101194 TaxID=3366127 RepID=UPI0037FE5453